MQVYYLTISTPFSSIHIYDNKGIHWAHLSNVCLQRGTRNLMVFLDSHQHNPFSERLRGYQHRWKFKSVTGPFPSSDFDHVLYEGDGSWMIIPGWSQHTSHFAENAMIVNHRASNPSALPPVGFGNNLNTRCEMSFSHNSFEKRKLSGQKDSSIFSKQHIH